MSMTTPYSSVGNSGSTTPATPGGQPGGSPYGPNYYGNPDVAVDGTTLQSQPDSVQQQYIAQYGTANAAAQYVIDRNNYRLSLGDAIMTPDGILMLSDVVTILHQHGYTGPLDANSVATAYAMLRTPSPSPATATAGSTASTAIGAGLFKNIPQPLLIGGGALLVFMLLFRGRNRMG